MNLVIGRRYLTGLHYHYIITVLIIRGRQSRMNNFAIIIIHKISSITNVFRHWYQEHTRHYFLFVAGGRRANGTALTARRLNRLSGEALCQAGLPQYLASLSVRDFAVVMYALMFYGFLSFFQHFLHHGLCS